MGSRIELNDTLKLVRGKSFPAAVEVGGVYRFQISGRRLYHLKPVRVFLVEEVDGKWNFKGQALILEQTIDAVADETRGVFEVTLLYPPEYAAMMNRYDAPAGKGLV